MQQSSYPAFIASTSIHRPQEREMLSQGRPGQGRTQSKGEEKPYVVTKVNYTLGKAPIKFSLAGSPTRGPHDASAIARGLWSTLPACYEMTPLGFLLFPLTRRQCVTADYPECTLTQYYNLGLITFFFKRIISIHQDKTGILRNSFERNITQIFFKNFFLPWQQHIISKLRHNLQSI